MRSITNLKERIEKNEERMKASDKAFSILANEYYRLSGRFTPYYKKEIINLKIAKMEMKKLQHDEMVYRSASLRKDGVNLKYEESVNLIANLIDQEILRLEKYTKQDHHGERPHTIITDEI